MSSIHLMAMDEQIIIDWLRTRGWVRHEDPAITDYVSPHNPADRQSIVGAVRAEFIHDIRAVLEYQAACTGTSSE